MRGSFFLPWCIILVEKPVPSEKSEQTENDECEGVRCSRGRCVLLKQMCDGVKNCEDGNDESDDSCRIKRDVCEHDPYHRGCGKVFLC